MKFKLSTILLLLILGYNISNAQYDQMFTQYMYNEMQINPAYAGSHDALSLSGIYRNQWVGIEGSPKTETFSAHMPAFNKKMGLGLGMLHENIGVTNRTYVNLNYAYKIPVSKGILSMGFQTGLVMFTEKLTEVTTTSPGDVEFAANTPVLKAPNFGTGLYYYASRFYLGFSIPRMIENKFNLGKSSAENQFNPKNFHYYLTTGYVFDIAEDIKLKPSVLAKVVQGAPLEADLSVNVLMKEKIWAGLAWRTSDAVSAMVGLQINPQCKIAYSYDYTLTALQDYNSGSHEIILNYIFSYSNNKIITPRLF